MIEAKWLEPQSGPRGILKYYMLNFIRSRDASGYDILKTIEERTGGAWRPGAGSIYPVLNQLKREGYVEQVDGEGRMDLYRITLKGQKKAADVHSVLEKAADKWQALCPLMMDIVGPSLLADFMIRVSKMRPEAFRYILESEEMNAADKAFYLSELRLDYQHGIALLDDGLERLRRGVPRGVTGKGLPARQRGFL